MPKNKKSLNFNKIIILTLITIICVLSAKVAYKSIKKEHSKLVQKDIENYDRFFWNQYYKKNRIKNSYKVVIVGPSPALNGRVIGDETLVLRMVRAVKKLNWEVRYYEGLRGREDEVISFNPDFIITTIPKWDISSNKPLPYKIYSFIPLTYEPFITKSKYEFQYTNFNPQIFFISDGLIITDESFLLFKELYEEISKNNFHGIVGYPGMDYYPYDESVKPSKMIAYGVNWDALRSSKRYIDLYHLLASKNIIDFYGPFIGWISNYRNGWKGILNLKSSPQQDVNIDPLASISDTVIKEIKEHGIVLILNSSNHLDKNLPSLRQFEAAAASAVIISDELPFIHTYFGDSALYITVKNKTSQEIEAQIVKHYEWIKANPDKVKAMTKKAHDIYKEFFILENLFLDIARMHESVIRNEVVDDSKARLKLKLDRHIKKIDNVIIPSINAPY